MPAGNVERTDGWQGAVGVAVVRKDDASVVENGDVDATMQDLDVAAEHRGTLGDEVEEHHVADLFEYPEVDTDDRSVTVPERKRKRSTSRGGSPGRLRSNLLR